MPKYPAFSEVRAALGGLKGVITKLGDAPEHDHKWKGFPRCPFCGHKDSAGVFTKEGADFFKCNFSECSTGGRVVTETGYINLKLGLSEKAVGSGPSPAYEHMLKMAGMFVEWQPEPEYVPPARRDLKDSPSRFNPSAFRSAQNAGAPVPAADVPPDDDEDEDIIQQCIEVIRSEQKASVSLLQRRLRLGYGRAARIMDELENRGIVGPSNGAEPREILMDLGALPNPVVPADVTVIPVMGIPVPEEAAFENLPPSGGVPAPAPGSSDGDTGQAQEHLVGRDDAGSEDPESGAGPTPGAMQPSPTVHNSDTGSLESSPPVGPLPTVAGGEGAILEASNSNLQATENPPAPSSNILEKVVSLFGPTEGKEEGKEGKETCAPGQRALRWFYDQLTPTSCEMRAVVPNDEPVPDPLPTSVLKRLEYVPVSLFERRGLTPETCAALGFRANPRSNEVLLLQMRDEFDWDELAASGLWLEGDRRKKLDRRPNGQFCGKGQAGRKPEGERRNPEDKWQWGWCQPVLIPSFDEHGQLVKLRPHKGGAAVGTAAGEERIYIPRALRVADGKKAPAEKFYNVLICEGEYKAAAVWQEIGEGAMLNYGEKILPMGVCALPGISFAKNLNYRADLEDWLRSVGCRRVIVAFDDEDKSDRPLRLRFDSKKYMRYLAMDLTRKLHVRGLFAPLPLEWRNNKGKADWDGALVRLLEGVC